MRQARVLYKGQEAGRLIQDDEGHFHFRYTDQWFAAPDRPAISLTLPKTQQEYESPHLFACFFNMLPEGSNKDVVCFEQRIDPEDHFGLLLHTARFDSIGAITIQEIMSDELA